MAASSKKVGGCGGGGEGWEGERLMVPQFVPRDQSHILEPDVMQDQIHARR